MKYTPSVFVAYDAESPADLEQFKVFLRQDNDDEDAMLTTLLAAATTQAEEYLQIALYPQTRKVVLNEAPTNGVFLDFGPITGITSIVYVDLEGNTQTLDDALYELIGSTVHPANNESWPLVSTLRGDPFVITYTASLLPATSPPTTLDSKTMTAIWLFGQILYDRNEKVAPMLQKAAERLLDTSRVGQGV